MTFSPKNSLGAGTVTAVSAIARFILGNYICHISSSHLSSTPAWTIVSKSENPAVTKLTKEYISLFITRIFIEHNRPFKGYSQA
jgi:hypothetical protein